MYFVPVKLFILEIKEKSLYWKKKKNCLASQCGLALTGSRVRPLGSVKQFKIRKRKKKEKKHLVFVSEGCLTFTLVRSLRVLHVLNQLRGRGWDPLIGGKFHVSICAVHIV